MKISTRARYRAGDRQPGALHPGDAPARGGRFVAAALRGRGVETLLCLFATGLLATPAVAATGVVQTTVGAGPVLVRDEAGSRIELPGRPPVVPELPEGAGLASVRELRDGWIAAGTLLAGDGEELLLIREAGGVVTTVAPPAGAAMLRRFPVLMVTDKSLSGLAWLEGDGPRSMAVRAALWDGSGWAAAEAVSQPGPGSQVALAGAMLDDGSWLLVWSAFDGDDDEIVWSRRADGRWSPPRAVHADNDVPDAIPAVIATAGGALAAWSRFDGADYRLRLARFERDRWRQLELSSPAGSLFPGFVEQGAQPYLLYRAVVPGAWTLVELDPVGRVKRRAVAAAESRERPIVEASDATAVVFRWPRRGLGAGEREATVRWERRP